MHESNETAATVFFLACCGGGVAFGVWYEWLWRLRDKRRACPHLAPRIAENPRSLGGHQWHCDECGAQRPATKDEVPR